MKEWYPYRFKTREEFIDQYGYYWRNKDNRSDVFFISDMDYLFGQPYQHDINVGDYNDDDNYHHNSLPTIPRKLEPNAVWFIMKFMLTENKKIEPTYKPKQKIERTL